MMHGLLCIYIYIYVAASVLVSLCLCCVKELLGFIEPLFSRTETRIAPLSENRPHRPEPNRERHPKHELLQTLSGARNCCQDGRCAEVCN